MNDNKKTKILEEEKEDEINLSSEVELRHKVKVREELDNL